MSVDRRLPIPRPGRWESEAFVADHLDHLVERRQMATESPSSAVFRGGQRAADEALAACTVEGYDAGRHEAYPQPRRSVSRLSPWIRHGLLSLPRVWETLVGEPLQRPSPEDTPGATRSVDVPAFREALLRQEYARHWYARLGSKTRLLDGERPTSGVDRRRIGDGDESVHESDRTVTAGSFDRRMGCIEITLDELEEDGWLPDPARRWLASQWSIRHGRAWAAAEEYFHRHLLDGSRAANRLGWALVAGSAGEHPFEFSRWQVEERAPGLCASCEMVFSCPIEYWPDVPENEADGDAPSLSAMLHDPDRRRTAGPDDPECRGRPDVVWLTAESLGREDPALVANPELPAIFVFDERLLGRLRLSSKRLVFLAETLAELATGRDLQIWLGDPRSVLADCAVAATFTPVPGWRRRSESIEPVETHPWPWLVRPHAGSIASFARWRAESAESAESAEKAGTRGDSGSRTIARLV